MVRLFYFSEAGKRAPAIYFRLFSLMKEQMRRKAVSRETYRHASAEYTRILSPLPYASYVRHAHLFKNAVPSWEEYIAKGGIQDIY